MMISPGAKVYHSMIVGEHTRGNDLEVNVLKGKQLTNVRASGTDVDHREYKGAGHGFTYNPSPTNPACKQGCSASPNPGGSGGRSESFGTSRA